jgi:DNA invertase Pin-like site-specific DNA recombinase
MSHKLHGRTLAAYVRVSSDKQDASRQRRSINEWASANGLALAHWFEDSTGRNPRDKADKRLDFQRLLKLVETGTVDAVIVDSQDRFGTKDAWELGRYISQLREHGCELWSTAQGNLSATDEATILTSTVGAITSTREQVEKAHRNVSGKIEKAKAGEYQGGYPPYGLDVVCFDAAGKSKWRVVWTAHHDRRKITGDKQERFTGRNNFPAKDPTDTLRYRPTVEAERVKIVRQVFKWYAEESISPSRIATRLNELKIDPVFGAAWNKQKIKQLLRNPAYVGRPAWNKRGGSRFVEYVNGQVKKVEALKGRIVLGRSRKPADFVQAVGSEYKPIIDPKVFDLVQRKLAASATAHDNPSRKPPRTASFWLRGLVTCAHCGKPMRAWNSPGRGAGYRSYFCGTYGTFGKTNPTGCRSNRVKAEVLEAIVADYLEGVGKKSEILLQAETTGVLTKSMAVKLAGKQSELDAAWKAMRGFIEESLGPDAELPIIGECEPIRVTNEAGEIDIAYEGVSVFDLYDYLFRRRKGELEQRIAELEAEHESQFQLFQRLKPDNLKAIDRANATFGRIEREIERLKGQLAPLDGQVRAAWNEWQRLAEASRQAVAALSESNDRRKAEALRGVVSRIVCHFKADDSTAANRPKSLLEWVEVFPVAGDPLGFYPNGIKPGPG